MEFKRYVARWKVKGFLCEFCGERIYGYAEVFEAEVNGVVKFVFYHPECVPDKLKKKFMGKHGNNKTLVNWLG